jgi:TPR repeat protein
LYERFSDFLVAVRGTENVARLKKRANRGKAEAQVRYRECLSIGEGIPVNLSEAGRFYRLAASQNPAGRQCNYRVGFIDGYRVPIDFTEPSKYFKLSVDQDDAAGQCTSGFCLGCGLGV